MGNHDATSVDDVRLLEKAASACKRLESALSTRIVGQAETISLMTVALLARGHAMLVGVPGLAKTLLVSSLAEALELSFGRVQFTPDLLPSDITGTDVLHEQSEDGRTTRGLRFLPGPIFHNLILADEVNRTPPKTQAALLQAMQEKAVTVGSKTYELPGPFHVFATRNPIEQEGTYLLPEAQLDRFLLEVHLTYPSESEEVEIASRTTSGVTEPISRVIGAAELRELQEFVPRIPVTPAAVQLAVRLVGATRPGAASPSESVRKYVRFGAGPRGSQALVLSAKARCAAAGRPAADVDDIRALAKPVLRHRLVLGYRAEAEQRSADSILDELLSGI